MFKSIAVSLSVVALTVAGFSPVLISDAGAKSYGGSRSFSRSSFRSSSSSSSKKMFSSYSKKNTSSKSAGSISKKKFTSNKKPVTTAKFTGSKNKSGFATVSSGKQTHKAKNALTTQRKKFKKPVTSTSGSKVTTSSTRNTYQGRGSYTRAANMDRSTYYTRRNQYYGSYNTPSYVYNTSSSFGMWDTIFLYSMLSSMNHNSHASQFAYNHQNDADYRAWRREADRLAQDNAELKAQLAQMDGGSAKFNGQAIIADYIPNGVDADIAMSQEVLASQKPVMRVCVGSNTGTYFRVTAGVLMQGINTVNIVPVMTSGTGEILENITNGKCDAGFVQADGYWNYVEANQTDALPFERVSSPYKEAVHLICNVKGPTSIDDLTASNKVWFPAKSGAAETWKNFVGEDSSYGNVKTVLNDSSMVVNSYEEAILKVSNDMSSCAMYVGAPGASKLVRNVDSGAVVSNLVLVDVEDSDLNDTRDPSGMPVYMFDDLTAYKNLNRQGGCYGFCSGDINTLYVNADFVVANNWKKANSKTYPKFALDMLGVQSEIQTAIRY